MIAWLSNLEEVHSKPLKLQVSASLLFSSLAAMLRDSMTTRDAMITMRKSPFLSHMSMGLRLASVRRSSAKKALANNNEILSLPSKVMTFEECSLSIFFLFLIYLQFT